MSTDLESRIIRIGQAELGWPFEGEPQWASRPRKGYQRNIVVDPTPCYPHDVDTVRALAERVESLWPMEVPPIWYLPAFEDKGRTNGWAWKGEYYEEGCRDGSYKLDPFIVLQGKRIPLHPAMTRYLVGHEYGHVVQYDLERRLKVTEEQFESDYAEMRGIEYNRNYGAGRWHTNTGEIIVNDFRVLMGFETEFWPHPGFARPEEVPAVREFWKKHQP